MKVINKKSLAQVMSPSYQVANQNLSQPLKLVFLLSPIAWNPEWLMHPWALVRTIFFF